MARSRVCACRGCEAHVGTCGWPTTNERRCDWIALICGSTLAPEDRWLPIAESLVFRPDE